MAIACASCLAAAPRASRTEGASLHGRVTLGQGVAPRVVGEWAASNGPPATRDPRPNPETAAIRPLDAAPPAPGLGLLHAALHVAASRCAAPPCDCRPMGTGPPRDPGHPRALRRRAPAARHQRRDDRGQPRLVGGHLRPRFRAAHALHRQERDPRLAAGWAGSRSGPARSSSGAPAATTRRASTCWCTTRWARASAWRSFPEGTTTEGDRLLKFHSSLFEPAVANRARVFPVAVRYENADGSPLRAAAYVGDLSFAQSLGQVIRTRETTVRIAFAEPIDPDGLSRQQVAAEAHRRVATLLGLPGPGTAPARDGGRPVELR